ncbi:MAG: TIGR03435 family protein [Acidobacteria bacterium]|nr:TIGR03435 family protein [Acidobacteriota bacterium]
MKIFSIACACSLLVCLTAGLFAQAPAKLEFEVASVKPSPPLSSLIEQARTGKIDLGAMRMDGARMDVKFVSLKALVGMAYKMKPHQITGPEWMDSQLFEIQAKLPEGSNEEQIPEMLQSLLQERFKLASHAETREQPVYALIVQKDGPKLEQVAEEEPRTAAGNPPEGGEDADKAMSFSTPEGGVKIKPEQGSMTVDAGAAGKMRMTMGQDGSMRMELSKMKMPEFAELLSQFTDRQVVDKTELNGAYKIDLELPLQELMALAKKMMPELGGLVGGGAVPGQAAPGSGLAGVAASDPSGAGMFRAVQKLGLKLDPRNMPTETLIIDHIEKEPTED